MQIELLVLEDCPLANEMRVNLTSAVNRAGFSMFRETSLALLPEDDPRRRYDCPAVLVDSQELFGLSPSGTKKTPTCRLYPEGVPTTEVLIDRLYARYAEIQQKLEDFR